MSTANEVIDTISATFERGEESAIPQKEGSGDISVDRADEDTEEIVDVEDGEESSPSHQPEPPSDVVSISGATADLPVALPVLDAQAQARSARDLNPNLQHATLRDEEAESVAARCIIMRFAVIALMVVVLTSIILGVTLGRNSTHASTTSSGPTPSPTTQDFASLQQLISSVSFDGGAALNETDSPQSRALDWLASSENLQEYPDWKRIQRYVLATLYFSTNADDWFKNDGWLSEEDECKWYSQAGEAYSFPLEACTENGTYAVITLKKNNMIGTVPSEVAILSDSLSKCVKGEHIVSMNERNFEH